MNHDQWIALFAPAVAALVLAAAGFVGALVTGMVGRANAWLTAHGQAKAAEVVSLANSALQPALQTGASVIAGEISRGELDYTNRAALTTRAQHEVAMVEQRLPSAVAAATPVAGALLASVMGKVDAIVVASPTIPSTPIVPPKAGDTAPIASALG